MAEYLNPLSVGERREPPMIFEGIVENVVTFSNALLLGIAAAGTISNPERRPASSALA